MPGSWLASDTCTAVLRVLAVWGLTRLVWLFRHLLLDDSTLTESCLIKAAVARLRQEYPCFVSGKIPLHGDEIVPALVVGWCFAATITQDRDMRGAVFNDMHVYRLRGTPSSRLCLKVVHVPPIQDVPLLDVVHNVATGHYPEWAVTKEISCIPEQVSDLCRSTAEAIVEHVAQCREERRINNACILLVGPPGTGKSTAARIAAASMRAHFTSDLELCTAGSMLSSLTAAVLDDGVTLLVLLDEIEGTLRCLPAGQSVPLHPKLRTQVRDRASWNKMCDDTRYTDGLIKVLTSNLTLAQLCEFDSTGASLRRGRVTAVFNVGGDASYATVTHPDPTIMSALALMPCAERIDIWRDTATSSR